jgi:predicted PhzF superfamily epimerase YddE/YHI9
VRLPIFQIKYYTSTLFTLAAVGRAREMIAQTLADTAESNPAETGFVIPREGCHAATVLTPTMEMDLCGQAH